MKKFAAVAVCAVNRLRSGKSADNRMRAVSVDTPGNGFGDGRGMGTAEKEFLRSPVPSDCQSLIPPDLSSAERIARGKVLYEDLVTGNCFNCLGHKGEEDGWLSSEYYNPPVANLSSSAFQDEVTDQYIFWRIREPIKSRAYPKSGMLGFPGGTDEQIWSLVAYVRLLKAT